MENQKHSIDKSKKKGELGTPSSQLEPKAKRKAPPMKKKKAQNLGKLPLLRRITQPEAPKDKPHLFMRENSDQLTLFDLPQSFSNPIESAYKVLIKIHSNVRDLEDLLYHVDDEESLNPSNPNHPTEQKLKHNLIGFIKKTSVDKDNLDKISKFIKKKFNRKPLDLADELSWNLDEVVKEYNKLLEFKNWFRSSESSYPPGYVSLVIGQVKNLQHVVYNIYPKLETVIRTFNEPSWKSLGEQAEQGTQMNSGTSENEGLGTVPVKKEEGSQDRPAKMKSGKVHHIPFKPNLGTHKKLPASYMGGPKIHTKTMEQAVSNIEGLLGRKLNFTLNEVGDIDEESLAPPSAPSDSIDGFMDSLGFKRSGGKDKVRIFSRNNDKLRLHVQNNPEQGGMNIVQFDGTVNGKSVRGSNTDKLHNFLNSGGMGEMTSTGAVAAAPVGVMKNRIKEAVDPMSVDPNAPLKRNLMKLYQNAKETADSIRMIKKTPFGIADGTSPPESPLEGIYKNLMSFIEKSDPIERKLNIFWRNYNEIRVTDVNRHLSTSWLDNSYNLDDRLRDSLSNLLSRYSAFKRKVVSGVPDNDTIHSIQTEFGYLVAYITDTIYHTTDDDLIQQTRKSKLSYEDMPMRESYEDLYDVEIRQFKQNNAFAANVYTYESYGSVGPIAKDNFYNETFDGLKQDIIRRMGKNIIPSLDKGARQFRENPYIV